MKKSNEIFSGPPRWLWPALFFACMFAAFWGSVIGPTLLHTARAQTAPLGNGGPAVGCADATLTCTGGYNVQLNLGNANTWTATQTFPNIIDSGLTASNACVDTNPSKQFVDGSCALTNAINSFSSVQQLIGTAGCPGAGTLLGTGGTINSEYGALCIGPGTGDWGFVLGRDAGNWGAASAANSVPLVFCGNTGSAERCASMQLANGSTLQLSGTAAVTFKLSGPLDVALNSETRVIHIGEGSTACSGTGTFTGAANTGAACVVTLSAGTATWTFANAFAATPVCTATDTTSAAAVKVAPAAASVTITGTSADVIDVLCLGNGGV